MTTPSNEASDNNKSIDIKTITEELEVINNEDITLNKLLHKAIKIAQKAHKNQIDKYDAPYLAHVFRVMEKGKTLDEKIVGVLHDVVEDYPSFSFDYLREKGFPEHIVFAVDCLTKRESEKNNYEEFVKRTELSALAIAVKINDLSDNLDLKRFNKPIESHDINRLNKYLKAYLYLTNKY